MWVILWEISHVEAYSNQKNELPCDFVGISSNN